MITNRNYRYFIVSKCDRVECTHSLFWNITVIHCSSREIIRSSFILDSGKVLELKYHLVARDAEDHHVLVRFSCGTLCVHMLPDTKKKKGTEEVSIFIQCLVELLEER